ncbi:MAG: sel1 repeat family protein [Deltaproteobacteria bacterium]|nr:sel1 repeat family protein [Deltaproteobacteria bacterium]
MKFNRFLFVFLVSCLVFQAPSNADQLEDAKAALDNQDFSKAYELLSPLAEAKNMEAQTRLGVMYVNGQGVERDLTKGLSLIMEAAKQGYDMAQVCALDVSMDVARAGDTGAMYNVAGMCLKGWGGEQDKSVCLGWLEEAAKLGHEKSGEMLNKIYTKGMYGITPDEEKATYWGNLLAAYDAGLDGTWNGEIPGFGGGPPMPVSFTFETDGDKLTGTTPGFGGQNIQIKDGKIERNNFSFKVKTSFGNMETTTDYKGEFYGDTIKLTSTMKTSQDKSGGASLLKIKDTTVDQESPPMTFIAKRSEL